MLSLVVALSACSGGGYLSRCSMVSPVASKAPVYEDADMRVSLGIVNDRRFSVEVKNKTAETMLLMWGNSGIVDVSGKPGRLMLELDSTKGSGRAEQSTTMLKPGGSARISVYPADHVYIDERGMASVHPLYYNGSKPGKPKDIAGKHIGVNLVMEVNGHAKDMSFMLKAEPPTFGY